MKCMMRPRTILQVFYYDGTIRCFYSKTHIGFAVFALVMGVVVILLFPVFILVISFKRFNVRMWNVLIPALRLEELSII